ncbi:uncharacterized protein LOC127287994 [Leptopilina boulardi]|uniref:uncharacterized protein LOC127287994 n=1 Tax=Leptopilina boulardi TaxID=63433 RepID=UPI0021F67B7A|nr:uncharacterized protein LOC127287994 [Leptopilina boulardi]XP_051171125.1 uncharacterized protein LOC127287994 [Leptopilina boulardi]
MMTVMCPNCQHRFPAPGCCNPMRQEENNRLMAPKERMDFYSGGGILVPRGFTSENNCFINAPTIVHGPTIIQTGNQNCLTTPSFRHNFPTNESETLKTNSMANHVKLSRMGYDDQHDVPDLLPPSACHITTNCDHKGGSVTITTPRNQSGGCVIKCIDSGVLFQSPVQMRPHLSGGGFVLQNRLSTEFMEDAEPIMNEEELSNLSSPKLVENNEFPCGECGLSSNPPSGCQELPGARRNIIIDERNQNNSTSRTCAFNCHSHSNPDLQIQVNATVQLPSSMGQCTVNITATTNTVRNTYGYYNIRNLNNLNGGGLIETEPHSPIDDSFIERNDENPSTPVSWLMPCPWTFNSQMMEKDVTYLGEVKKLLQTTGWYHEGMTWQESEKLLKDSPVGSWLMRDSSDSRYSFAVSVQTKRGPTSVRVHFLQGRFRLDAEPRLALAMPLFRCPIKMIEYYVDYSTRMDDQKNQVWIDYSGEIYSHIYMTKPFLKEVTSLSHLARLKVNAYNLPKNHLPVIIRKYLAEYPYSI